MTLGAGASLRMAYTVETRYGPRSSSGALALGQHRDQDVLDRESDIGASFQLGNVTQRLVHAFRRGRSAEAAPRMEDYAKPRQA